MDLVEFVFLPLASWVEAVAVLVFLFLAGWAEARMVFCFLPPMSWAGTEVVFFLITTTVIFTLAAVESACLDETEATIRVFL